MSSDIQVPSDFFLSLEERKKSIREVILSTSIIAVAHIIVLLICKTLYGSKRTNKQISKNAYQIVNFMVNLSFGLFAMFICFYNPYKDNVLFASIFDKSPVSNHIFGYEQYAIFGALQVGYNLWSLPVGILAVNESLPMIAHHISVIFVCSLSCISHYGYRLHAPFLLGMYEVSSVPLAIINYIKDHKDEEWTKNRTVQQWNVKCKALFGVLFLLIRIIFGTPHCYQTIRAAYTSLNIMGDSLENHTWSDNSLICSFLRVWIFFSLLGQLVLYILQIHWARLIVYGLINIAKGGKKGSPDQERAKDE